MRLARNFNVTAGKPGPSTKPLDLKSVWAQAGKLVGQHRNRLLMGMVIMIIGRLSAFVLPVAFNVFVDAVTQNTDLHALWFKLPEMSPAHLLPWLAVIAGVATLIDAVTTYTLSQVLGVAAQHAINDMRKQLHAHVVRLPVRYFDGTQTGVLIARIMTDAEGLRNLVGNGIVQLVGGVFTAILGLAYLFWLNWHLTIIILVLLAASVGAMSYAFSYLRPVFRERGKINAAITGRLTESIGGIRVVKAYTAEARERKIFSDGVDEFFAKVKIGMTGVSSVTAGGKFVIGVASILVLVFGGRAVLAGEMSIGNVVAFIGATGLMAAPVMQISSISTQISEAFAGLDRIHEVFNVTPEDAGDENREPCPTIRGDIEFKNVNFEYDPGTPVLRNVSFTAPAGTTTALVGSSGSGKSTLISLVMAFNRPGSGTVLLDHRDLANIRLADFRKHLGVVLQDNFLFDGSIRDNIAFSRPDATDAQIRAAAHAAHCDEFVARFPGTYDAIVGERGVKLSGGQRQRIAIARALLAEPRLLILDEATSSLDSESEAMIQDGLRALRRGRTTFVIAHRLSTIQSADQILVLEAGEIVERGTHEELLTKNGRYRQLYDKQYHFESERFINPGEEFAAEPKVAKI